MAVVFRMVIYDVMSYTIPVQQYDHLFISLGCGHQATIPYYSILVIFLFDLYNSCISSSLQLFFSFLLSLYM